MLMLWSSFQVKRYLPPVRLFIFTLADLHNTGYCDKHSLTNKLLTRIYFISKYITLPQLIINFSHNNKQEGADAQMNSRRWFLASLQCKLDSNS